MVDCVHHFVRLSPALSTYLNRYDGTCSATRISLLNMYASVIEQLRDGDQEFSSRGHVIVEKDNLDLLSTLEQKWRSSESFTFNRETQCSFFGLSLPFLVADSAAVNVANEFWHEILLPFLFLFPMVNQFFPIPASFLKILLTV